MSTDRDALIDAIADVINDEGGRPDSGGLHSWRCSYPGRYGRCDCVRQVASSALDAIELLIRADERDLGGAA